MPHAPSPQRSRLYFAVIRAGAIAIRKRKEATKSDLKLAIRSNGLSPPLFQNCVPKLTSVISRIIVKADF